MILQALRAGTVVEHRRLEARLDLPRRLTTPRAYCTLLARFYGYYAPLEARLGGQGNWSAVGLDFAARRKLPLLQRDLSALGLTENALMVLPQCSTLPSITTLPQAIGCLYVLEGSTLGGQIIARQIRRTLAITATSGGAFFQSYGDEVGAMWHAFGAAINSYPADPASVATMLDAARATFSTLERWLLDEISTSPTSDAESLSTIADSRIAAAREGR